MRGNARDNLAIRYKEWSDLLVDVEVVLLAGLRRLYNTLIIGNFLKRAAISNLNVEVLLLRHEVKTSHASGKRWAFHHELLASQLLLEEFVLVKVDSGHARLLNWRQTILLWCQQRGRFWLLFEKFALLRQLVNKLIIFLIFPYFL